MGFQTQMILPILDQVYFSAPVTTWKRQCIHKQALQQQSL